MRKILKTYRMSNYKSVTTPLNTNQHLEAAAEGYIATDSIRYEYASLVGYLLYGVT